MTEFYYVGDAATCIRRGPTGPLPLGVLMTEFYYVGEAATCIRRGPTGPLPPGSVKGTLTRDFRPLFFFIKQLPLGP
jgi:hypothetical protein